MLYINHIVNTVWKKYLLLFIINTHGPIKLYPQNQSFNPYKQEQDIYIKPNQ